MASCTLHSPNSFDNKVDARDFAQWFAASSAAAMLVTLTWFNAVNSPAFDFARAGAYLLRTRRGSCVPLMRIDAPDLAPIPITRLISYTAHSPKEGTYVRRVSV